MTSTLPLPPGTPSGVSATLYADGAAVYRDERYGVTVEIPGQPRFVASPGEVDAAGELLEGALRVRLVVLESRDELSPSSLVQTWARDHVEQPGATTLPAGRRGVQAAAWARRGKRNITTAVAILAGPRAEATPCLMILIDHDTNLADPVLAATVASAIIGSARFEPSGAPAAASRWLVAPGRWLEPGLPLRLRADAPALPPIADGVALADELLDLAGLSRPGQALDDVARAAAEAHLAAAIGADAARDAAAHLATVHDLRGLALAALPRDRPWAELLHRKQRTRDAQAAIAQRAFARRPEQIARRFEEDRRFLAGRTLAPNLTDDDKAALAGMLRADEAHERRRRIDGPMPALPPGGTFEDKWREPFLPVVEPGRNPHD